MKTSAPWSSKATAEAQRDCDEGETPPLARAAERPEPAGAPAATGPDRDAVMRDIASELTRLSEASRQGADAAAPGDALRDAVAQIARRQALLDRADLPAADEAAPARRESPALGLREDLLASVSSAPWPSPSRPEAMARDRPHRAERPRVGTDLAAEVSQTFARFGRDLRDVIEGMDARPGVEALKGEVRQIGRAVDGLGAGLPSADVIARIGTQTREMRDMLETGTARAAAEASARRGAAPPAGRAAMPPDFASTMAEVRGLLEGFKPGATMARIDARLERIAERIEGGLEVGDGGPVLQGLRQRVDEIHASLDAHRSATSVDTGPLEGLIGSLADRVAQAREASADFRQLEESMREVAARIGAAASGSDPRTVHAIETQLTRVAERLERSEASFAAIEGVDHQLAELLTQLEATRQAAVDAAEVAARTAARDTLRAALQNPLLIQKQPDLGPALADQVARGLESLRTLQDQAERRTQNTVADLRATVERLVGSFGAGPAPAERAPAEAAKRPRPAVAAEPPAKEEPRDLLIEPGFGRTPAGGRVPARPSAEAAVAPEYDGAGPAPDADGPATFIAAARRAAQAAQASVATTQKTAERRPPGAERGGGEAEAVKGRGTLSRARAFLSARRRPLLLGITALVVAVGALEVARVLPEAADASRVAVAEPAPAADAPAAPAEAPLRPAAKLAALGAEAVLPPAANPGAKAPLPTFVGGPGKPAATPDGVPEGLRAQAGAGDAAAQYEVALRYAEGRGVSRDTKQAAAWFSRAADQGLAPAEYRLGSAYEKGVGLERDATEAVAWYQKAAEAGNVRAMHNLAVMAAEGSSGKSDYGKAAQWFEKASVDGVRDSQFNLAILYARGLGVEQSFEKSYTWFAVAAAAGDDDAGRKRDEVAAKLDPKQLAAAKTAADDFHAASPPAAANDVPPPAGGWDAPPARPPAGPGAKVSQL